MPLSLAELSDKNKVFAELNAKWGTAPMGRVRKWTVGDLIFNRPSQDDFAGLVVTTAKPFTVECGKSNGTRIEVKVVYVDVNRNTREIVAGSIVDK
jgi:hypothetical protein